MRLISLRIEGAWLLDIERHTDDRGFFGRTFCAEEYRRNGLDPSIAQCNVSFNARRGTVRGMHYQAAPHEEAKTVTCVRGAIHDVIVDLRAGSSTYRQWVAIELRAEDHRALYVPKGLAHGFQTLEDKTIVDYRMSVPYRAELARGVRWDDPSLGIHWPLPISVISPRDIAYPSLEN